MALQIHPKPKGLFEGFTVISGGAYQVDQVGWDARKFGINIGGNVPKGGFQAGGPPTPKGFMSKYNIKEIELSGGAGLSERTKMNMNMSDAVIMIFPKRKRWTPGQRATINAQKEFNVPFRSYTSDQPITNELRNEFIDFLIKNRVKNLNVAGSHESVEAGTWAKNFLYPVYEYISGTKISPEVRKRISQAETIKDKSEEVRLTLWHGKKLVKTKYKTINGKRIRFVEWNKLTFEEEKDWFSWSWAGKTKEIIRIKYKGRDIALYAGQKFFVLEPQIEEPKRIKEVKPMEVEYTPDKIDLNTLKKNEVIVFGSNYDIKRDEGGFHGAGLAGSLYGGEGFYWRQDGSNGVEFRGSFNRKAKGLYVQLGVGEGYQKGWKGESYAIPTVKKPRVPLDKPETNFEHSLIKFISFAKRHSEKKFYFTELGKDRSEGGHSYLGSSFVRRYIDKYRTNIPKNVILPRIYSKDYEITIAPKPVQKKAPISIGKISFEEQPVANQLERTGMVITLREYSHRDGPVRIKSSVNSKIDGALGNLKKIGEIDTTSKSSINKSIKQLEEYLPYSSTGTGIEFREKILTTQEAIDLKLTNREKYIKHVKVKGGKITKYTGAGGEVFRKKEPYTYVYKETIKTDKQFKTPEEWWSVAEKFPSIQKAIRNKKPVYICAVVLDETEIKRKITTYIKPESKVDAKRRRQHEESARTWNESRRGEEWRKEYIRKYGKTPEEAEEIRMAKRTYKEEVEVVNIDPTKVMFREVKQALEYEIAGVKGDWSLTTKEKNWVEKTTNDIIIKSEIDPYFDLDAIVENKVMRQFGGYELGDVAKVKRRREPRTAKEQRIEDEKYKEYYG